MENKRVIDITTSELVDLIRMVLKEEKRGSKYDIAGLLCEEFIYIKDASKLIRYSVPSIYRKVRQKAIRFTE